MARCCRSIFKFCLSLSASLLLLFYTIKHWTLRLHVCVCLFYVRLFFFLSIRVFLFQECFFNAHSIFNILNFVFHSFFFLLLLHLYACRICRCIASWIAPAPITEAPTDLAKKCDPAECALPYCFCSKDGTTIPGGLEAEDVSRHFSARL